MVASKVSHWVAIQRHRSLRRLRGRLATRYRLVVFIEGPSSYLVQQIADDCDSVHDLDCTKVLNRLQGCIGNVREDDSINEHSAMYIESVLSRPYLFCHLFLMTVQMRAWVPVLLHLYCSVTPQNLTRGLLRRNRAWLRRGQQQGCELRLALGCPEGCIERSPLGCDEGTPVGCTDGCDDGSLDGCAEGCLEQNSAD
jgi:hypothetical protein